MVQVRNSHGLLVTCLQCAVVRFSALSFRVSSLGVVPRHRAGRSNIRRKLLLETGGAGTTTTGCLEIEWSSVRIPQALVLSRDMIERGRGFLARTMSGILRHL
jgi:hypothetical protein